MRRVIGVAVVALCLMGTSSLALAADAMKESGKLYGDQIEPKNRADAAMKEGGKVYGDQREPSPADAAMKGKKKEHKKEMKTH